ncbi:MAG TPA: hypothetical protein DCK99_21880, partial [Blastocatellia bacterium]|nr:hypothetical protein [Blastocatellia bacterium]
MRDESCAQRTRQYQSPHVSIQGMKSPKCGAGGLPETAKIKSVIRISKSEILLTFQQFFQTHHFTITTRRLVVVKKQASVWRNTKRSWPIARTVRGSA